MRYSLSESTSSETSSEASTSASTSSSSTASKRETSGLISRKLSSDERENLLDELLGGLGSLVEFLCFRLLVRSPLDFRLSASLLLGGH